jgi:hypothetical protein
MGIRSYESSFELHVVVVLISMIFFHSLWSDSKVARRCEKSKSDVSVRMEQSGHDDYIAIICQAPSLSQ